VSVPAFWQKTISIPIITGRENNLTDAARRGQYWLHEVISISESSERLKCTEPN